MFKKSQIAITDLFIALFVAAILITVIVFTWNKYTTILEEDISYNEMGVIAFQASDLLVKSKGEPLNWEENPTNVDVLGLASSDRNLSIRKIDAFVNLSYSNASKLLGTGFYNFYFKLKHINGTILTEHGKTPNNTVINVQRLVWYDDEKAFLEFALWK